MYLKTNVDHFVSCSQGYLISQLFKTKLQKIRLLTFSETDPKLHDAIANKCFYLGSKPEWL